MKKIFAGIVLPTLAAAAVIGSGFSIWFFGENQDKVSTEAGIAVDNILRIGEMGKNSSAVLHLDQTNAVRNAILTSDKYVKDAQNENFDKNSNYVDGEFGKGTAAEGLYLVGTGTSAFDGVIKYEAPENFDVHLQTAKIEIVTTFTFTGGLENYVGMVTPTVDANGTWTKKGETAGVFEFKWNHNDIATEKALKLTMDSDAATSDFKFEYVAYTNQYGSLKTATDGGYDSNRDTTTVDVLKTAEPHTDREYKTMLDAVKTNGHLKIETIATIFSL